MSSKLREALSDACYAMFNFLKTQYGCRYEEMAKALDKAKAALAEPLRNCDVGTEEEQSNRFDGYCRLCDGRGCDHRLTIDETQSFCALEWAQMPYESEVK